MGNKKVLREIKKEQLLYVGGFLDYCNFDYHHQPKLHITEEFLNAAEKDGFLHPLSQTIEKAKNPDGTEKEVKIDYYSPHQIFIAASLSLNQIDEGALWANQNMQWYKEQGFRMVNWGWGGMAFTITRMGPAAGKKFPKGYKQQPLTDILNSCADFHNFLKLLHSLEQSLDFRFYRRDKERHFTNSPQLQFDFSPLKTSLKLIKEYGLSAEKLRGLRKEVASLASQIDPLESWYPYIKRHAQWRKDLLKGDAMLAQKLYNIFDFITEAVEAVTGNKEEPLFELINRGFANSSLIEMAEYVMGTDIEVFFYVIEEFKKWASIPKNKEFVSKETLKRLNDFVEVLKDFKNRYGSRHYLSNISLSETHEVLALDKLDEETRKTVENMMKSYAFNIENLEVDTKRQLKEGKISLDKAKSLDRELQTAETIENAISYRLLALNHALYGILSESGEKIRKATQDSWERRQAAHGYSANPAVHKKLQDEAEGWNERRDELDGILWKLNLVFCNNCRKNFVKRHHSNLDQQVSLIPICDECIEKSGPGKIKEAELTCEYCGNMLYKFAYKNRLNDLLFNQAPANIDVVLEYGRLKIEIKCKDCGQINKRWIDWGWVD